MISRCKLKRGNNIQHKKFVFRVITVRHNVTESPWLSVLCLALVMDFVLEALSELVKFFYVFIVTALIRKNRCSELNY